MDNPELNWNEYNMLNQHLSLSNHDYDHNNYFKFKFAD